MADITDSKPEQLFLSFLPELEEHILPIYATHEMHFDPTSLHGRMHICRALLYAEWMGQIYLSHGLHPDMYAVRVAVAFHDSGRQNNGTDYWEHDSATLCRQYLLNNSPYNSIYQQQPEQAAWIAALIPKEGSPSLEKQILHDADVLEYLRLFSSCNWRTDFKPDRLFFLNSKDAWAPERLNTASIRDGLIREAWDFITLTDDLHSFFSKSPKYFEAMLDLLEHHKVDFPLLSQLI